MPIGQTPNAQDIPWYVDLASQTEFWAAVVGALVGAAAGGAISYVLQRMEHAAAARQRADDRRASQRGSGFAILYKAIRMHAVGHQIAQAYAEGFIEAQKQSMNPGSYIRAISNMPPRLEFAPEEMALILSLGDDSTANQLMAMDVGHNSIISSQDMYNSFRGKLEDSLPGAVMVEGTLGTTEIDETIKLKIAPIVASLDDLAAEILSAARRQAKLADLVLPPLTALLNQKLSLALKIEDNPDRPK